MKRLGEMTHLTGLIKAKLHYTEEIKSQMEQLTDGIKRISTEKVRWKISLLKCLILNLSVGFPSGLINVHKCYLGLKKLERKICT